MRVYRQFAALLVGFAAACSAVPLRPELARAEDLPRVRLTAREAERVAALERNAVTAVGQQQYAAALTAAADALLLDPRAPRARAVRALASLQGVKTQELPDLRQVDAADTDTLLALQLAPQDAFVAWARVVFLRESLHLSAAAEAGSQALERCTDAPVAERAALLEVTARCRYELGEERAALPLLQTYTGLRPGDAAAFYLLGCCLLRLASMPVGEPGLAVAQAQAEAAARAFRRCSELQPEDRDASLAIGAAWFRAAELAAERKENQARDRWLGNARQQFQRLLAVESLAAEANFRLGLVEEFGGDRAAAMLAYRQAAAVDPQHVGALLNLASLLAAAPSDGADPEQEEPRELLARVLAADQAKPTLTAAERRRIEAWLKRP